MDKQYLEMGRITNTHGIRGEVKAQSWGDYPEDLAEFEYFYVGKQMRRMEVEDARPHKNMVIIKFAGVDTCDQAEQLKNSILYLKREELGELEEGTYYIADLEGLTAQLEDGTILGKVKEVLQPGGNDVLVIKGENGKQHLVPFIQQFVPKVDLENGTCTITPIEGLLDDEI